MSLNGFLDQLLKSAAPTTLSGNDGRGGLDGMLGSDFGKGAMSGGALGLLLGRNKTTRKLATYGGLAALGVMAYRAYGDYRAQQGAPLQPETVDRLPPPQANIHGEAILRALVAAAKADGHIDAREREVIEGEFARIAPGAEVQRCSRSNSTSRSIRPRSRAPRPRPDRVGDVRASLVASDEQSFRSAPTSTAARQWGSMRH